MASNRILRRIRVQRWRAGLASSTALVAFSCMGAYAQDNGIIVAPGQTQTISDQTIDASGNQSVYGVRVNGPGSSFTGNGLTVNVESTTSSFGSPSAGLSNWGGTSSTTGSVYSAVGTHTYGLHANGNATREIVMTSTDDAITTHGDFGIGAFVYSAATGGSSTLTMNGSSITTNGANGYGLLAQGVNTSIAANALSVETDGASAIGAYAAGGSIGLFDSDITTRGQGAYGAYAANEGASLSVVDSTIETRGNTSAGARASDGSVDIQDSHIVTYGEAAHGAHASNGGSINLNGGSVRTLNEKGRYTQEGDGARSHALYSVGVGSSITATGTTIETRAQRSYGAHATGGASMSLSDLSITTDGFMAYGVYLWDADTRANLSNVDITTNGQVGDAVTALDGSRVEIDGGTITVNGERNPNSPGEVASGLISGGTIEARGVTVITNGAASRGVRAGVNVSPAPQAGLMSLTDSSVTVNGADAIAAEVSYGGTLSTTRTSLNSTQGVGVSLFGNATANLADTTITAGEETFVSNLNSAGQSQQITVSGASVATQNNGTLLRVNRTTGGADGDVQLTLGTDSVTSGDIIDEDADFDAGGGTDVTLEEGATWTGLLQGVRNFFGFEGGEVNFEGEAEIAGHLEGNGTSYSFSDQGGTIGGNVDLNNGSQTTGGTIDNRINVRGDVAVDETSTMGGNWNIDGDLSNAGTLTPGNSIGRVSIGGNLLLTPTSIYAVDIDAMGDADLVEVAGTATLAGSVTVTPLGGFLLGSPYTILTAGTRAGEFEEDVGFAQETAFLDAFLSYDPNTVFLTIERNDVEFASVAETPNQAAAARAVDQLPLTNTLASAIALSTSEGAAAAFDQLSGEIHASVNTALTEDSRHIRNIANDRIRAAFGNAAAAPMAVMAYDDFDKAPGLAPEFLPVAANHGTAAWGTAFGSWGTTDGNGNAAELDRSTGGVVVGVDGTLDTWRIGALAGYSHSSFDVDDRASSGSADNLHLGLYGGTQWGAVGFRTGLAYTWSDVETQRSVAFPGFTDSFSADYDAGTFQAFGELGYSIETGTASFEPFINLAHVNVRTDGFTETGGAAALSSARSSTDTTFTTLGLRASTDFVMGDMTATARGMIGWRHAFGDTTPFTTHAFAGSDAFTVAGAPIAKDAAVIEAGLDFAISPAATLGVSYNGQIGSGSSDHGGRIGLDVKF